ncbi:hypothetical protein ASG29_04175 [Sphingomonas sp. Leaf412]|uniref:wax ester/triacylglycerol synthase family O-acyltransferase n=1 Tax=Sphingomonas sp. Leaf412 TaxID=1736370 RepID=UPI000701CD51|nr:wax ester/triacylglycerol synthase family O-acyltransferase [Sphingomonas sp. Leaf412]KQT35302.1 hypothetical protein ASG29_04175 [Sphingomonas sp. Leaf412]
MKRIEATDAAFLDVERPNTPPLIGALIVLDPATAPGSFVRHRDILSYLDRRLHLAPNLRKRLMFSPLKLDEPVLVDDENFDLEFHVRHIGLPRPRDRRQLGILAARLMSRPMDVHRPLWELYVIEGLEDVDGVPADAFAILIKLHHAAFDGAAGAAAIWALMQAAPDAEPEPPAQPWVPERAPGVAQWAVGAMFANARQWVENAAALTTLGERAVRGALAARDDPAGLTAPRTRFQAAVSSHRVLDWVIFPLSEFKAMRARLGRPKMNDLVLTIIAGALRRYLERHGENPGRSLVAMCPINVRGAGDALEGGNKVTAMRVAIGTDIADPVERLAAIQRSSMQGKEQAEQLGGTFFADLLALTPYAVRGRVMRGVTAAAERTDQRFAMANLVVTNVPNPPGDWYFAGSKFLAYAAFGPMSPGLGLFHVVTGMDWEMSISVTSTREIMPDIADYIDDLRASYEEVRAIDLMGDS